jgi:hypothetical protein
MPTMRALGRHIQQKMRTVDGVAFYGYLWTSQTRNLPDTSFVQPRRFVRVDDACALKTGDTIVTASDIKYLTADNVNEEFRGEVVSRSHRLFLVDKQRTWTRDTSTIDPVTGMKRKTGDTTMGLIWSALEPVGMESDQIKISQHKYRLLVAEDVQVNDRIDGLVVRSVTEQLGLRICEVAGNG